MAAIWTTPTINPEKKFLGDVQDLQKEGVWFIEWADSDEAKEDKKNVVGIAVNYYVKNDNSTKLHLIDKCGGSLPLNEDAFADVRKFAGDSGNICAGLTIITNPDYKTNGTDTFNFTVYYEPTQITYKP